MTYQPNKHFNSYKEGLVLEATGVLHGARGEACDVVRQGAGRD